MAFHLDYDPLTGNALYAGWALPGTADAASGWRIVKPVFVGDRLDHILWADGDDLLDNVWTNRAVLSYSVNGALALDAAGYIDIIPSGIPGTLFDLGFTIPARAEVVLNSTPMRRVLSITGPYNDVVVAGTSLQTAVTVTTGDWFYVRVPL